MNNTIGIYIHIPFCNSKCFYCDFYSECNNDKVEEYINALCEEILQNAEILENKIIDTVYFGGGTPSSIDSKYILKIMDVIKLFPNDIKEATIEVNPESVTDEKLNDYKNAGINRISIGLQSINNSTLKKIGRIASKEDFQNAYNLIVKEGFKNISLDIITGLPVESINDFKNTIDFVLSLKNITHISSYSLEVHENTKLDFLLNNGFLMLPSEDDERNMKYLLDKKLNENGFLRYEISNYSKIGFESKHNLRYWNQEEYLGFGAAASSFLNSTRYSNISDINTYILNINRGISNTCKIEEMDIDDLISEYIILRLRLKDGVIFEEFKDRFKIDFYSKYKEKIDELTKKGLLIKTNYNIYLSNKGEDLANIVWQEFI